MQNSYTKSKQADKDIQHITKRSMADFGEIQTDKYMGGLEETLDLLADNPESSRIFTHGVTKRRYFFCRHVSHVVYYRKRKNDILVLLT